MLGPVQGKVEVQTDQPATKVDLARREMHRLVVSLAAKGADYAQREAEVKAWWNREAAAGRNPGELYTVLKHDVLLRDISGGSKTIADILTAFSAYVSAEVAYTEAERRCGVKPMPPGWEVPQDRSRA